MEKTRFLPQIKYDSYQWYRNNEPIPGATNRYYVVHQVEDEGTLIKVAAAKDGCTAFSKRKLIDGWAFLNPIIIETGDIGTYDPYRDALVECPGDTLILTLGDPYSTNVQWYNNSKIIQGATTQTYLVTKKGSYTVCGAPEVCPNFRSCELIPVNVSFDNPAARITQSNDTLFASTGKQYQWFYNGRIIRDETNNFLVPQKSGSYTVGVINKYNCSAISDPYIFTVSPKQFVLLSPNPAYSVLHVQILRDNVRQIILADIYGNHLKQIITSDKNANMNVSDLHTGTYVLQLINDKGELVSSVKVFKQ